MSSKADRTVGPARPPPCDSANQPVKAAGIIGKPGFRLAHGQRLADAAGLLPGADPPAGSGRARPGALAPLLLAMIEGR